MYLPFTYQMYFPVALISGRLDQPQVIEGLVIQAFWTVSLILVGVMVGAINVYQFIKE